MKKLWAPLFVACFVALLLIIILQNRALNEQERRINFAEQSLLETVQNQLIYDIWSLETLFRTLSVEEYKSDVNELPGRIDELSRSTGTYWHHFKIYGTNAGRQLFNGDLTKSIDTFYTARSAWLRQLSTYLDEMATPPSDEVSRQCFLALADALKACKGSVLHLTLEEQTHYAENLQAATQLPLP